MKNILLLTFCILFISCNTDKENSDSAVIIGDFSFSSKKITPNKPFTIAYNGDEKLGNSFCHYVVQNNAYPVDLIFTDNKATLSLEDSVDIVSFFFKVDEKQNSNNNKGYLFEVLDKNENSKPHIDASKQLYLMGRGAFLDLKGGDQEIAFKAMNKLLDNHPEYKDKWYQDHLFAAFTIGKQKADQLAKNYLSGLLSKENKSLLDYTKISKIYSTSRNQKKADSINAIIIEKYPDSDVAQDALINEFYKKKTFERKKEYYSKVLINIDRPDMNFVHVQLADAYFRKGDFNAFEKYLAKVDRVQNKTSLLNNLAWANAEKGNDLVYSLKISEQCVELLKSEMNSLSQKPDYYSENQYKERLDYDYKMYLDTYAYLLYKNDRLKDAIKYQGEVVGEGLNIGFNERYLEYLTEDKQFDKVYNNSKIYIAEGNSSDKIKYYFKTAFEKLKVDEEYNVVLADLEAKALAKYTDKLKDELIENPAPDFQAKNLKGENYTLESLKGKTVVLDFWATWCGPCKDSFPGMQKVLNKYQDDTDVVFLFVDTFEKGEDRLKKVSSFIEKEGYSFEVLIDPYNENKGKFNIAGDFDISGIPTKIIIDKNSNIRFKDVGYGGSEEKLMRKLDIMLGLIK